MYTAISDIRRVFVYDDNEDSRSGSADGLREVGFEGVPVDRPPADILTILNQLGDDGGLFCDYHLRKCGDYAVFDGDAIVAEAYKRHKPALLCTSYSNFDNSLSRVIRRYIPVILTSRDLQDLGCIVRGFELCIDELKGKFSSQRKPWRALVRVVEVDDSNRASYVVVPSWQADFRIQVFWDDFPNGLKPLAKQVDRRFHAMVNLGSEYIQSLYLYDWEES